MKDDLIERFANDELTNAAVYQFLFERFMRKKSVEVQYLAASRIALDMLEESWSELQRRKTQKEEKKDTTSYL